MTPAVSPIPDQFSLRNYAFAGIAAGRQPFFLPDSTKPSDGVGYPRNLTLEQTPLTEITFLRGDGKRKIGPLVLTGTYKGTSEEEARIWGGALEESIALWATLQRNATITRALRMGGHVLWGSPPKPHIRPYTLTLYPAGPTWLDGNSNPVPF